MSDRNHTPSLLNRSRVKSLAMDIAAKERAQNFTQVSKTFLDRIEGRLIRIIQAEVRAHPSKGKTLK